MGEVRRTMHEREARKTCKRGATAPHTREEKHPASPQRNGRIWGEKKGKKIVEGKGHFSKEKRKSQHGPVAKPNPKNKEERGEPYKEKKMRGSLQLKRNQKEQIQRRKRGGNQVIRRGKNSRKKKIPKRKGEDLW